MTRVLLAIVMLSALAACNGPTSLPFNSIETQTTFPGGETKGVAAKYVVYTIDDATVSPSPFIAAYAYTDPKPVDGKTFADAIVTYPDGSTQMTDSNGAFDASQSSYAAAHPEDPASLADITVTISGSDFAAIHTSVFAPSAKVEATEMSGTIPATADDVAVPGNRSRHTSGYIWSCNPADYEQKFPRDNDAVVGGVEMADTKAFVWYAGEAYGCATDQPARTAKVVRAEWRREGSSLRGSIEAIETIWKFVINYKPTKTPEVIAIWASPDFRFYSNRHLVIIVNHLKS